MDKPVANMVLAPCPFCGEKAFASSTLENGYYVMCRSEDCWAMAGYLPTKEEAIAAWNRRSQPSLEGEVGEMIELLLDAQQDINLSANETMSQPLADASALIDKVENLLRALSADNARLSEKRDAADNALVDRYRNPSTGHFSFPDDVAAIVRRLDAAEARLSEAVEVLKPFAAIGDAILAEAPHEATKYKVFVGQGDAGHFIALDACRAAHQFLDTQGGGNG